MKKKQLNKSYRIKVIIRDNYQCQKCGMKFHNGDGLEIHHITPEQFGGLTQIDNLVSLCKLCHVSSPNDKLLFNKWINDKKLSLEQNEDSPINNLFIKFREDYYLGVSKLY
ncbi:MAG: HNH endonuclease [Nanoarchaeota archaeon]|nr:HNH endonuclease [Nanoarchaeota archaeon]